MSEGGFKERDAEVVRPPGPIRPKLFEDVHFPAPQLMVEPVQGLGRPDPRALLDWVDDAPAAAPSNLLGFGHNAASSAPIQLNLNAPRKPLSQGPGPQLPPDDLARVGDTMEAQRLLTSKNLNSGAHANEALQILNDVPEEQRGKAIDGLNEKAFENLLERVPHGDREKFEKLVEASKDPKRKLKLWAEFHKSRARNDLGRLKGDIGEEDPKLQHTIAKLTRDTGDPDKDADFEGEEEEGDRTDKQERNFGRHHRRTSAVVKTHEEVDSESERLLAKAENKNLTLDQVDEMIERKDLEYRIERDNNMNLTAERGVGLSGEIVTWEKDELERLNTTLARLPEEHVRDPKAFGTLNRKPSPSLVERTAGEYKKNSNSIDITDWGASNGDEIGTHAGDARELVSDQFRREHGDKINTLEYVVTHEIGHDVAEKHKEAFANFKKAAGWEKLDVEALRKDNVDDAKLATLEGARPNPNQARLNVGGNSKTYSPIKDETNFWGVDKAAIPSAPEPIQAADPSEPDIIPKDKWQYSRVDPQEHFAEVYAKAVHVPVQLHDELVVQPAAEAKQATDQVKLLKDALADAERASAPDAARVAAMKSKLTVLEADAATKVRAEKQRGAQFSVMRNDVFHTNVATTAAAARLQARGISPTAIGDFQQRAAAASTPEQVEMLERELHP